jgi:hypothetical protein
MRLSRVKDVQDDILQDNNLQDVVFNMSVSAYQVQRILKMKFIFTAGRGGSGLEYNHRIQPLEYPTEDCS